MTGTLADQTTLMVFMLEVLVRFPFSPHKLNGRHWGDNEVNFNTTKKIHRHV